MQLSLHRVLSVLALCLLAGEPAEAVTPVAKVIQLLNGMMEKGKAAKHEEELAYTDRKRFCDDHTTTEKRSIKEEEETEEVLAAEINKASSDAKHLGKKIHADEKDISVWEGDIKAATKVRNIEKTDFASTVKDYADAIDSLRRATAVLKKQQFDRKQASSLLQLESLTVSPSEAKKMMDVFLQTANEEDEEDELSAPEADAYESQSGGVVDMLEKLLDKFLEEKTALEKEEANKKHAFQMLVQDLKAQIDLASDDRTDKSESKMKKMQHKAADQGDLKETEKSEKVDKTQLSELQATCSQEASEYEARQQVRGEEIEAIEKAIEILSGGSVSGNADKYLPSMIQTVQASALGQLRATRDIPAQERAMQFLQARAGQLNSRVLSAVAQRVMDDPFGKVKKMIKDLVVRLMEEANEEAEHKGWCDAELGTNQQTREEKTTAVETLRAEIDELSSSIQKISEDLGELQASVAEITSASAEATKMREDEKVKNQQTVKDAQDAQTAVAQALVVLKEFYEQAGEATAFLQIKQADEPYQGMQAESGGVIGMLEVIQSDFARLEAETTAAEASGQKEYDEFMQDSAMDKATKSSSIEHKQSKKQDQEQELTRQKQDLEGTQKELDTAMEYFEKLKPSCLDSGVSYEDRVARRKEEIESLQEALKVLQGEDIA